MVRVKICGIKSTEDAHAVAALGADALGFHIGLDGGRSPLSKEEARAIIKQLPTTVTSVVVTSISDVAELIFLAQETNADVLQLYGNIPADIIPEVKRLVPDLKIWKVISVEKDVVEKEKRYEEVADIIVLDTAKGGTGKTHDWNISKRVVDEVVLPVILAGGLNPENVAEAIRIVQPYGVDVNSGVSNADGTKNIENVRLFIERAKGSIV